jgi:hypothetical protein
MPRAPKSPDGVTGPAKPRRASTRKPGGNGSSVSEDQVAKRAYEIFESRGGRHGADLDDWLEAERQLKQVMVSAERTKTAAV